MQDDLEVPDEIPRKRRQVEAALDKWLAVWLTRDDLAPSDRRRLESEKARRKALHVAEPMALGLIVAEEGMTPEQWSAVCDVLRVMRPTVLVHTRLSRRQHGTLVGVAEALGAQTRLVGDVRDESEAARLILHEVDMVVAAPREATVQTYATPGVWSTIGLARHRRLAVQVVLPNGDLN